MPNYILDFLYGATKYPCALWRPRVFWGHFCSNEKNSCQKEFYELLLKMGFQRTVWQLVFPGQIAGLIKKIPVTETGENEYHVRFYSDGTIECELEVDRWSLGHWTGPRKCGVKGIIFLNNFLEAHSDVFSEEIQSNLRQLFGVKNFTLECVRNRFCK